VEIFQGKRKEQKNVKSELVGLGCASMGSMVRACLPVGRVLSRHRDDLKLEPKDLYLG